MKGKQAALRVEGVWVEADKGQTLPCLEARKYLHWFFKKREAFKEGKVDIIE